MGQNRANHENNRDKAAASLTLTRIAPMTAAQCKAFEEYLDNGSHLFLHGLPGTGKTFIALYLALHSTIIKRFFNKVIIVRSVVPTRNMGFLPGDDKKKSAIYEIPYLDAASKLFDRGDAYHVLKQKGFVEFMTTSFVRGTNLDNAVVIVDEVQNMSEGEIHSVVTRLGENTRLILSGDIGQDDLTSDRYNEYSGLREMMKVFDHMKCLARVEFGVDDIVRSQLVREYIIAREEVRKAARRPVSLVRAPSA